MKFEALATDYDGTIAFEGHVDEATIASLRRAREEGRRLILVTGRELPDLFNTFDGVDLFDRVVAENGAVIYNPVSRDVEILAAAPPPAFVEQLAGQNIPLSVGHAIVATVEPHEHAVIAAIHELALDWHVIFNKGSVMALPSNVTKLSGLGPALEALGVSTEATIGIGDAENDLVFLRCCGLAASVANALPAVRELTDLTTAESRGAGVSELIQQWLAGALDNIPRNPARKTEKGL